MIRQYESLNTTGPWLTADRVARVYCFRFKGHGNGQERDAGTMIKTEPLGRMAALTQSVLDPFRQFDLITFAPDRDDDVAIRPQLVAQAFHMGIDGP